MGEVGGKSRGCVVAYSISISGWACSMYFPELRKGLEAGVSTARLHPIFLRYAASLREINMLPPCPLLKYVICCRVRRAAAAA